MRYNPTYDRLNVLFSSYFLRRLDALLLAVLSDGAAYASIRSLRPPRCRCAQNDVARAGRGWDTSSHPDAVKLLYAQQQLVDPVGLLLSLCAIGCLAFLYLLVDEFVPGGRAAGMGPSLALDLDRGPLTVFAPSLKLIALSTGRSLSQLLPRTAA